MIKPIAFLPLSLPSPASLLKFPIELANYAQVLEAKSENGCSFSRPGLKTGVEKGMFVFFPHKIGSEFEEPGGTLP